MIKLTDISKKYEDNVVLSELSLLIRDNEHVAIMGKSGCGKTTLLRIIANLEQMNEGKREGYKFSDIAFVFQEPRLFSHLTVLENVTVASDKPRAEASEIALKLLEKVGLKNDCNLYPHELSGGMAQRVAIARAMITDLPILILDEPFSALDESTRAHMISVINEHCTNKTLLFVTHNAFDAELLANRIIEL